MMNEISVTQSWRESLERFQQPVILPQPTLPAAEAANGEKPPLRIAIIGTAPSSRDLAPYADKSWTIWGCSPGNMGVLPRFDCWFELHSVEGNLLRPEHASYGPQYIKWLQDGTFPIVMQDNRHVPRAMPFPLEEFLKTFWAGACTSSFAWMIGYAIMSGAQEIGLYGVDMASRDEYILQRSGGQYFIHEARKRGIKVTTPPESDVDQLPPLYGFCESSAFFRKLRARDAEIKGRIAGMTAERDRLIGGITYLQGAAEDLDYMMAIWGKVGGHSGD